MNADPPLSTRLLSSDPVGRHIIARLLDFFADSTPWQRRLWDLSSVLSLQEAAEAGDWVRDRVLSSSALRWYLRELERQLGPDRGLGDTALRRELTILLRSDVAPDSRERRRLVQMLPMITDGYLRRWAAAVDTEKSPSPERLARAIATHLLDSGHSSGSLHRWAFGLSKNTDATVSDLLAGAVDLAELADQEFEVLVPFVSVPDPGRLADHLPHWLSPARTSAWFAENGSTDPPRHNGAFIYTFRAKDAAAAGRSAAATVRRLEARRTYARGAPRPLVPVGRIWVAGHPNALSLAPVGRGANILSLESEGTMYVTEAGERIDEALELAAPLNNGSVATAAAGGWAAIESLLTQPADEADVVEGKVVAADRIAALVTCSWPRAELTALSYRHRPIAPDGLAQALSAASSNLERSRVLAEDLQGDGMLQLSRPSDVAAAQRMRVVLAEPRSQLGDVRTTLCGVFRRLYRQRNIVVHGGNTSALALDATLRTIAPLVGAGFDRLLHAQITNGVQPLDLAARAENSLALVGDPLGPDITTLLESPMPLPESRHAQPSVRR